MNYKYNKRIRQASLERQNKHNGHNSCSCGRYHKNNKHMQTVKHRNNYNNCDVNDNDKSIEDCLMDIAIRESLETQQQEINNISNNVHNIKNIITGINKQGEHIDFIIGRGNNEVIGHLNININPYMEFRNIMYIDKSDMSNPDINNYIQNIDFGEILNHYNKDCKIRLIFDWATFYCSAMIHMIDIAKSIEREYKILVPLERDEHVIHKDILNYCPHDRFICTLAEGEYPLFDWSKDTEHSKLNKINQNKYILIIANYDR